ncbi:MAG: Asp-tRNA(Asn)/Glu-tRNA(Gln) amidotransferase subunit GatB [Candidatus Lokiarchaeota archaeon]|nr:Asp-tRNA(Asn)/Glu-tRNA(Gln) amidotransferase subunit GatB [Candidatus Lokiarchaeota archaeon]MBD3200263.1 Asp-tRNA(Asn)/Glu-tRNA(Gln) amidotransferase subunit GatB [Candidatus Lokiarchaeota archaeon]
MTTSNRREVIIVTSHDNIIIGLEIHVQLTKLKTKLFCSCSSKYRGAEPNTYVCPICIGLPGSLPVLNEKAVEFAMKLAIALGCKINKSMYFFRKNYFYPDLPKGFQITQYNKAGGKAFGDGGKVIIKKKSGKKEILLNRIHIEEDPGRLVHKGSIVSSPYTLVDYNRSGVCLIEIVTEPVINSPEEAREFLNQLKSIIQYCGIADLDLEGSVRVDANISIKGHARSEIKNINSFKEVQRALKWEIRRQKNFIKRNKLLKQETRHWDDSRRVTVGLRSKEFEKDYRYFPEQDLVPIELKKSYIEKIKNYLPEMPNARMKRFQNQYGLSEFDSEILVMDKDIADFYEEAVNSEKDFESKEYKLLCNWLKGDISRWLNLQNKKITDTDLTPIQVVNLVKLIEEGRITGKIAKSVIGDMMLGTPIKKILKQQGKKRIADEEKLSSICKKVIQENSEIIKDYKTNPRALEALIGKCMKETHGQADPKITRKLLLEYIEK